MLSLESHMKYVYTHAHKHTQTHIQSSEHYFEAFFLSKAENWDICFIFVPWVSVSKRIPKFFILLQTLRNHIHEEYILLLCLKMS